MSICVRFVEDSYIREEFIGFVELTKTDAETISQSILSCMEQWGLDITKLRGQGYDGASVMSGHVSGVQSRIREVSPKAVYVHCRSHNLNLVVTHSCKTVHPIRKIIDNVVQLTWFVCASANRKNILKEAMANDSDLLQQIIEVTEEYDFSGKLLQNAGNKQSLQPLSETRWTARVDSLSAIISNYSNLHNALITIEENSSGESKVKAGGHGRLLEDPEFIMGITVAQYVLSYLKPLTLSLQKTDCNMVIVYDEAQNTLTTLRTLRTDEKLSKVFQRAQILADSIEVLLQPRRRTGRQVHRDNPNVNTAEQLWRATIYYAFLDHVCTELERRFPREQRKMMLGQYLVPCKFNQLKDSMIDDLKEVFGTDLPDSDNLSQEVTRWKMKFQGQEDVPRTLQEALTQAHSDFYPNIRRIFIILMTLPVTSVCCERSFSSLRRLKTWERATMGGDRLCGLALLHVHRDKSINRENILKRFDETGHRKIGQLQFDNQ